MKLNKSLLASAVALFASATVSHADVVINITGSTAFRAAAHNAILAVLSGEEYAYDTAALSGADKAIFVGTVTGISGTVTIRTDWSGSAEGISDIATGNPINVPVIGSAVAPAGLASQTFTTESVAAKFAFSDVSQSATNTLSPTLEADQVGVIPFQFVVNDGAPAGITNMTDQLFAALYSVGSLPLKQFTGVTLDTGNVVGIGRNSGSGTRITVLAETGFGINNPVKQAIADVNGDQIENLAEASESGNGGYSSGSDTGVRARLKAKTDLNYPGISLIGYLGISDASNAVSGGARTLTYNGVAYSTDNVKNGSYTLWGYQYLLNTPGLTTDESTFKAAFISGIPAAIGSAGIRSDEMNVIRSGNEGGPIVPNL
jgi:hypothetical protein